MASSSVKSGAAKVGALGFGAIALGCAALAAFLVGDMMKGKYTGTKVVPVVVAKSELRAGTPVTADGLMLKDWPVDAVPAGAFHSVEELVSAHKGSAATVGILPGEPVVVARLSSNKQGTGIASLIRRDMRAIALKVDDSVGYTGLVYPGAYVDVIATIRDPLGRGPSSRIAVQNARVLSLGMDADVATRRVRRRKADRLTSNSQQTGTYVTLEVSPEDAETLSIARNEGKIDLILRNGADDKTVATQGATPSKFSAFAGQDAEKKQAAPAAKPAKQPPRKRLTVRPRRRRIQLVAHERGDKVSTAARRPTTKKIETYNAN